MRNKLNLLLVLAMVLSAGCATQAPLIKGENCPAKFPDPVRNLVKKAQKDVKKVIKMEAFKEVVEKKNYDMIIDVRTRAEFAKGHVKGAINIPRGLVEFVIWKRVGYPLTTDITKKIYTTCKSGGRASLTAQSLKRLGFTNVTIVDMKIAEWKKAKYPWSK